MKHQKRKLRLRVISSVLAAIMILSFQLWAGPTSSPFIGTVKLSYSNTPIPGVSVVVKARYRVTRDYINGNQGVFDRYEEEFYNVGTDANGYYQTDVIPGSKGPFEFYLIHPGTGEEYLAGLEMWGLENCIATMTSPHFTVVSVAASSFTCNFLVQPAEYTNRLEIPLTYINTQIKYGYQKLNKYLHQVSSNGYTLTCGEPTVTLNPSTGKATFFFSVSAKMGSVNLGSHVASIEVPITIANVSGSYAIDLNWALNDLSFPSGAFGTHMQTIRSIVDQQLAHDIYISPPTFSGTIMSVPSVNLHVWNMTRLASVTVTTSAIQVNVNTGWHAY